MLTLDTQQISRQRRADNALIAQERMRSLLRSDIRNKEVTTANDGELCTTSLDQQLGTPLSSAQVIERLKKMNASLVFEVAIASPDKMGVYVIENAPDPVTNISPRKRYVTGMMRAFMPERTVRHVKQERVLGDDGQWKTVEVYKTETRGWRRVLSDLLRQRLITTGQIERYFPPNLDSQAWKNLTT